MPRAAEGRLDAVMDQVFPVQPRRHADLVQQLDRALFEHTRAYPRQHVVAVLALDDDRVDAAGVQQRPEQQTGRASADDGDLCAQRASPSGPCTVPFCRGGFAEFDWYESRCRKSGQARQ